MKTRMKISVKLIVGFAVIIGFCVASGLVSLVQINSINGQINKVTEISVGAEELIFHADYMVHMMHHYLEDTDAGIDGVTRGKFNNHSEEIDTHLIELAAAFPEYSDEIDEVDVYHEQINELCVAEDTGIFDLLDTARGISDQIHTDYPTHTTEINTLIAGETNRYMEYALELKYSFERKIHMMHHYLEFTNIGVGGATRTAFAAESVKFDEYLTYLESSAQDYSTFESYDTTFETAMLATNTGMFDLIDDVINMSDQIHSDYPSKMAEIDTLLAGETAINMEDAVKMKFSFERQIHLMHHYLENTGTGVGEATRTAFAAESVKFAEYMDNLEANSSQDYSNFRDYHDNTYEPSLLAADTGMFDLLDDAYAISEQIHADYPTYMAEINTLIEGEINRNLEDAQKLKYHFERQVHMMHHYLENTGTGATGTTRATFAVEGEGFTERLVSLEANSSQNYSTFESYHETFETALLTANTGMFDILDNANNKSAQIHVIFPQMISLLEDISEQSVAGAKTSAGDSASLALVLVFGITIIAACVGGIIAFTIITSISKPINSLVTNAESIGNRDLRVTLSTEKEGVRNDEVGKLEFSFADMVTNLTSIISTAQQSAEHVASSAEELASTSEEVNALSEEIAATIQQISRGASSQSELAIKGIDDVGKMSKIVDESLGRIENTLHVIEDIASQTNILALNAAIEAARAGEYGRGFAVVADNVRRLAEETKNNAAEINTLTDEIVTNIGGSVSGLQETLQGFAAQSEEFSASSEEVAAATEEQTAAMNQMTTSAQDLTKQGEQLSQQVAQFKLPGELPQQVTQSKLPEKG